MCHMYIHTTVFESFRVSTTNYNFPLRISLRILRWDTRRPRILSHPPPPHRLPIVRNKKVIVYVEPIGGMAGRRQKHRKAPSPLHKHNFNYRQVYVWHNIDGKLSRELHTNSSSSVHQCLAACVHEPPPPPAPVQEYSRAAGFKRRRPPTLETRNSPSPERPAATALSTAL